MNSNCLYCYKPLSQDDLNESSGKLGYHIRCSKKFFGKISPPVLPYSQFDIIKLAEKVVKSHKTVTGVQPKLSLGIGKTNDIENPNRFTIVGLWGDFILKPQTELYPNMPELESLTMHLAAIAKIATVEHSLIHMKSGELAYITKRVDRNKNKKNHMEDMCQLTERLTEQKYKGSYEQIAKTILRCSKNPGYDVLSFYEVVIFSFLTGNNDMHLKNFSLLKDDNQNYNLCPAYDLIASKLLLEEDDEELALNLNGKKKKLKRVDFEKAMMLSNINDKVINNMFNKFGKVFPEWLSFISKSFLPNKLKKNYCKMLENKSKQIDLF